MEARLWRLPFESLELNVRWCALLVDKICSVPKKTISSDSRKNLKNEKMVWRNCYLTKDMLAVLTKDMLANKMRASTKKCWDGTEAMTVGVRVEDEDFERWWCLGRGTSGWAYWWPPPRHTISINHHIARQSPLLHQQTRTPISTCCCSSTTHADYWPTNQHRSVLFYSSRLEVQTAVLAHVWNHDEVGREEGSNQATIVLLHLCYRFPFLFGDCWPTPPTAYPALRNTLKQRAQTNWLVCSAPRARKVNWDQGKDQWGKNCHNNEQQHPAPHKRTPEKTQRTLETILQKQINIWFTWITVPWSTQFLCVIALLTISNPQCCAQFIVALKERWET